MKRSGNLILHITIFVTAQLFWLCLLGLWIYWYVSNYIIFEKVGDQLSPQILYDGTNVFALVGGIVLLVAISFSMSFIFRQLNVQLKLTNMYDNFIATITHELKSPLSSIQLYLETLTTRTVPDAKKEEFYRLMLKDSERLKKLINSILEIAALEQKRLDHNYAPADADKTIRKIISSSTEQFNLPKEKVAVTGSISAAVLLDKASMGIVFDNLFDNAIKYSKHCDIHINLKENASKIYIDFKDNGIGIPLNEQKKVFNKFYRVHDKNSPNVKGTGLGLYWVKEIIKGHGGKISAVSEGSNKGTIFRIELPIFKPPRRSLGRRIKKILARSGK